MPSPHLPPSRDLVRTPRPVRSRSLSLSSHCSRDPRSWHPPGPRLPSLPSPRLSIPRPRSAPQALASFLRLHRHWATETPSPPPSRGSHTLRPSPPARLPFHSPRPGVPSSPTGSRPPPLVREHRLRPLRPPFAPANQKPAAGEPKPDSIDVRGAVGVVTRSAAPIGWGAGPCPWRRALFVSDVRPGRQCWRRAAPLPPASCPRVAAWFSRPGRHALRTPRTRRHARLRRAERPARAGACAVGAPLGPSLELAVVGEL